MALINSSRGSAFDIPVSSTPIQVPSSGPASQEPPEKNSTTRGILEAARKRGYRTRFKRRPWVLRSSLHCPEEDRGTSAYYRPKSPEHLHLLSHVQNGKRSQDQGTTSSGGVDDISRPFRRLFAPAYTPVISQVHENAHRRKSLAVQSNVLWTECRTSHLHQDAPTSGCLPKNERSNLTSLLGRLVSSSKIRTPSLGSHTVSGGHSYQIGLAGQPIQVRAHSFPKGRVSRNGHRPSYWQTLPNSRQTHKDKSLDHFPATSQESHSSRISLSARTTKPHGLPGDTWQTTSEAPPILSGFISSGPPKPFGNHHSSSPSLLPGSSVVGERGPPESRHPPTPRPSFSDHLHRRKQKWVGSVDSRGLCSRTLGRRRSLVTHFGVRVKSRPVWASSLAPCSPRKDHSPDVGQHSGSGILKEPRGNSLHATLSRGERSPYSMSLMGDQSHSDVPPREEERCGRPALQIQPDPPNRMDAVSPHLQPPVEGSAKPRSGSLCHSLEQTATQICLPLSGRSGMGDRCLVDTLDRPHSICISPIGSPDRGPEENQQRELPSVTDCSLLAEPELVPSSPQSPGGLPNSPPNEPPTTKSASTKHLPHRPTKTPTSRLATIHGSLVKAGFSEKVASRASRGQRKSSIRLYESKYRVFCDWCTQRHISAHSASVQDLADFLLHLHEVKKLSPKTIANYRSALSQVIPAARNHEAITRLLKSFLLEAPPTRNRVPDWDLSVVLNRLRGPPFEPLKWEDSNSRMLCTMKTVFLLALASGRRRGELQAISRDERDLIFNKRGMTLRTVAGFLPKTGVPSHDPQPFYIPALTPFSGRDNDDRLLCPVRALKFYLFATGGYQSSDRLFRKVRGEGHVSSQTVSAWLVRCIKTCYDNQHVHAHAHEVRRVAASWAYVGGSHSMEDILSAGTWASHNTFSSFYLADVQTQPNARLRLQPIISGKQVVGL